MNPARDSSSLRPHFLATPHVTLVTIPDPESVSSQPTAMGVQKKTRKFATVKRIIGQKDARLKQNQKKGEELATKKKDDDVIREV